MKDILIFPAHYIGYSELSTALSNMEEVGILKDILVICEPEFLEQKNIQLPQVISDDFSDTQSLIKKIEAWKKAQTIPLSFKGIIAIDDDDQFALTKAVANAFTLPFYSEQSILIASNKYVMKRSFEKEGVPTSTYGLIKNSASDEGKALIERIGFPNVLKILNGNGSECVFKNKNFQALEAHLCLLKEKTAVVGDDPWFRKVSLHDEDETDVIDPKKEFLLEGFVRGTEYSLDFMYTNERAKVLRVVKKIDGDHLGYFSGFYLMNEESIKDEGLSIAELENLCVRIAKSFKIKTGTCMVDFKVENKDMMTLKVIESSIRPGLSVFMSLMKELYKRTSLTLMAWNMLEEGLSRKRPEVFTIPKDEGLAVYLRAPHAGKIVTFDTEEVKNTQANIMRVHKYSKVGDIIVDSPLDHHGLTLGYVLIKNPQKESITQISEEISKKVIVKVE